MVISMLLFMKEWKILISILKLTTVHDDIDASIYERVKNSN